MFEGWQTAGLNALRTEGYVKAKFGRLATLEQAWGWRPEGLVEAATRGIWMSDYVSSFKCLKAGNPGMEGFKGVEGFEGWQTAGLNALRTEGYVQAKGRLQPWNSKGWRPEGLVEAAARDLESFKSFKCLKPGKRMPRRRVLRVWRLANGMLERPNNRGLCVLRVWRLANGRLERPNNRGLCAGKGQAATLEQQRLTSRGFGGSCREGSGGF